VPRATSRAEVRAFLIREVERQRTTRIERHPYDTPNVRSSDVNAARQRAGAIYGLTLAPITRFAWEGWSPNDCDSAWPALFDRALTEIRWREWGLEPTAAFLSQSMLNRAADLAAEMLHDLASIAE
jgi:hypothetical protein